MIKWNFYYFLKFKNKFKIENDNTPHIINVANPIENVFIPILARKMLMRYVIKMQEIWIVIYTVKNPKLKLVLKLNRAWVYALTKIEIIPEGITEDDLESPSQLKKTNKIK